VFEHISPTMVAIHPGFRRNIRPMFFAVFPFGFRHFLCWHPKKWSLREKWQQQIGMWHFGLGFLTGNEANEAIGQNDGRWKVIEVEVKENCRWDWLKMEGRIFYCVMGQLFGHLLVFWQ
jgi:hypothetical protein